MFYTPATLDLLAAHLLGRAAFHPFPTAAERAPWDALPAELRARLIADAEPFMGVEWPFLPAVRYMDYQRNGNRSRYEALYFRRRAMLGSLVLAECLEGQGRFLDDIITGTWALCEETSWVLPAHNQVGGQYGALLPDNTQPLIDLFAAETGALLAWTHYLLAPALDAVTPLVTPYLRREVTTRIIDPALTRTFGWQGDSGHAVNNWNPWCNSNILTALLLLEDDDARRVRGVTRVMETLDRFLAGYHPDGGCDEGPSYWDRAGGSLYDCVDLLRQATGGALNFFTEPLVAEIGRYIMRVHISGDHYINFADGPARLSPSPDLIYRYGVAVGDPALADFGAACFPTYARYPLEPWYSLGRALPQLFDEPALRAADVRPPFQRDVWMPGIEVMAAREAAGSDAGFYLAVKGGHNAESHNHNDIGQCLVFLDGRPVLVDPGVETYTQKTFSPRRYELWTMQSGYHNLPAVNGVDQHEGRAYGARDVVYAADDASASLSLDIAGAYPPEAGLARWQRTCRLHRDGSGVEIIDDARLAAPGTVRLHYVTAAPPQVEAPGRVRVGDAVLRYPAALRVDIEEIPLTDVLLTSAWGDRLYRLIFTAEAVTEATWTVTITRG
jgi:hypothetical protein